jgi:hypothetical protein
LNQDRPIPDWETSSATARETATFRRLTYLKSASIDKILHEQLDYLIDHAARSCAPGCSDCARLQQVQGLLLLPFRGRRRVRSFRAA